MRTPKKPYESTGEKVSKEYELPTIGDVSSEDFQGDIEQQNIFDYRQIVDLEKFMQEPVLVEIPRSSNPNDDPYIQLGVNGIIQPLLRGKKQWIKRKFLEILVRSMPTTLETIEEMDHRTGNKIVRLIKTAGEKYPYRVLEDNNANGRRWLNQILFEAQQEAA